ncbi:MAG: di-heme oxidoredictase family protein [Deltaproteobacteria bacterium]|nr:di-heme oxidoredictase family protein [Deltaproteobacteria bacterium]
MHLHRAVHPYLLLCVLLGFACKDQNDEPAIAPHIFAPLGQALPAASAAQQQAFMRGAQVARRTFTPELGLGPHFNVASCGACHERPVLGGSAARYRNFLLVAQKSGDGTYLPLGKGGVQDHYTLAPGGRLPSEAAANVVATRNPIPMFGVGLIAELEEGEILRNADENDRDRDGISGRPNFDRGFIGRFGRKAQTVSIEGFIRGPLMNHLGITSAPLSEASRAQLPVASPRFARGALQVQSNDQRGPLLQAQAAAPDLPNADSDLVPDPELSEQDLFDVVSFSMLLAAPQPDAPTPESEAGRSVFDRIGCAACHVPTLKGPRGSLPLYSDLLLHDMGAALADGVQMGLASGSEFRTQPLWGVAAVAPYLHDGRADSLDEAIRSHGGEAQTSREKYEALSTAEQDQIATFLLSLGGRSQLTPGLLAPATPLPSPGQSGAPDPTLGADALAQFARGRAVFDRDVAAKQGLGPNFNGDSCRACHFHPTVGGAGPLDVDVIRQGIRDANGVVAVPVNGSMAHRHAITPMRPAPDPAANVFENRQTPSLFGAGLIDRIPAAAIMGNADPLDVNGDGIVGRPHMLADGRLGRFGWKADVPSLPEFVRDALSNEMGLTLPAEGGLTFGAAADLDAVADPEMQAPDIQDLLTFVSRLAPPARHSRDPANEAAGAMVFAHVACSGCHVPSLPDDTGQPVALFSDLLLHDVAAAGASGIPSGNARARDFRTPPLWGLADTAPYMHDGRAATVEAAIAAHAGEAAASVTAFSQLDATARAQLLAFLSSL